MNAARETSVVLHLCLALAGLALPVAGAAQQSAPQVLDFEVLLDGKAIGTHQFRIERPGQGIEQVYSRAEFTVRFLGIPVYRYQHRAEELWRDGCLSRIDASTDDNGSQLLVRGASNDGRFGLQQPAPLSGLPECVAAYAYWDAERLLGQRALLNPQTGKVDAVRFTDMGKEQIQVQGTRQEARRWRLQGEELQIDLWYSADGRWLQLASKARGDRQLLYRLGG